MSTGPNTLTCQDVFRVIAWMMANSETLPGSPCLRADAVPAIEPPKTRKPTRKRPKVRLVAVASCAPAETPPRGVLRLINGGAA
jgi:hypothetical protein